jgi:methylenetetrahydrofolate dehydrogenase (NADP+) / methenyltetrahydrofolate cyclohydrolase
MAIIFDGRAFTAKKEEELKKKVTDLKSKGITPHLASILVGNDPASTLYVGLKKKAAERIGAELSVYRLSEKTNPSEILQLIELLNNDKNVNGIMIQLPLPDAFLADKARIINLIDPKKDVDGLREDSKFLHPTSKAVMQIIGESKTKSKKICVVGGGGMVGSSLVKHLYKEGYEQKLDTLEADIVVSATGEPNIIKADSIKKGTVVIDVGSPKGDVDFSEVSKKADFITPVPGGVGPVTISALLENLISAV